MNLFGLSGLLTAVTSFSLAIFVLVYNRANWVNRIWFLFAVAVAWWGVGVYQISGTQNVAEAFFWWRAAHIGVIMIPVFFVHFVYLFMDITRRRAVYFSYLFGFLFLISNTTPYFIANMRFVFGSFYYDSPPGILYIPFVAFFIGAVSYSALILYRRYLLEQNLIKKRQVLYFLLATIIGFGGGVTSFLPVFGVDLYPVLNFFITIYTVILAIAVLRYQLFDIRVISAELLTFSTWVFLFLRGLFAESIQERLADWTLFLLVVIFGIFLILSVRKEVKQREEIQRLAESLKKANAELKKLDQLKSEFLSLASHQLRTPLSIIKGYISMIQEGSFGQIPDRTREILRKVYFSNERMINLVNDFLNISRIESGRMHYDFEPARVEDVVQNALEEFREAAKDKKLDLIWEPPPEPLPEARLDKEKFHQVIMNLVDNAFHYTQSGFVKVGAKLNAADLSGKTVLISVRDSGVGMTPEELDVIFKRFSRGEGGSKVNASGLGLGLYLAKRIVADHGGEIWAESEGRGKGSTFWIKLLI